MTGSGQAPDREVVMSEVAQPVGRQIKLEDRYELRDGAVFLTGLQAIVRIPVNSTGSTSATV